MVDSSGKRLYVDTGATPVRGITLKEIERVLGDYACYYQGRLDLGLLCRSGRINPWARHKPFRYNAKSFPSDAAKENAMKQRNFGFDIGEGESAASANSPAVCLSNALSNGLWTYLAPRGEANNEWYRLLDFNGYNHGATAPYAVEEKSVSVATSGTRSFFLFRSENSEISLEELGILSQDFDPASARLGLIIRKTGYTDAYLFSLDKTLNQCFTNGYESIPFKFVSGSGHINQGILGPGNYQACWCVWNSDGDPNGEALYVYLPDCTFTISYSTIVVEEFRMIWVPEGVFFLPYVAPSSNRIKRIEAAFSTNVPSIDYDVVMHFEIWGYNDDMALIKLSDATEDTATEISGEAGEVKQVSFNVHNGNYAEDSSTPDKLFLKAYYDYRVSGNGEYKRRYMDLVLSDISTVEIGLQSVQKIWNAHKSEQDVPATFPTDNT